jgi:L-lactate dehydrogenase complex protein LldG
VAVNQTTTPKEKILKKIRQALINKSKPKFSNIDLDSNVYDKPNDTSILETFARNFTESNGQFVICDNKFDFIDKFLTLKERWTLKQVYCRESELQAQLTDSGIDFFNIQNDIHKAQATITSCEALIARTGSVLVSSSLNSHQYTITAPIHIVVASASQLVMEIKDAFILIRNKYGRNIPGMLSVITGPSCTADIEKTVVYGAHGPQHIFVFLIDDLA